MLNKKRADELTHFCARGGTHYNEARRLTWNARWLPGGGSALHSAATLPKVQEWDKRRKR